MIVIKKKIINEYINFSDDVKNNTEEVIRNGYGQNTSWGAIIEVYDTLKYIERIYFDFKDNNINVKEIKIGNVLNIRKEIMISYEYSLVCDQFYLITKINNNEIILENHPSVAKTVKAQRSKSVSSGYVSIPSKSKWQKYSKHKSV